MTNYDVIICGAGPSGSTAAKYIAQKGLKVLLLDKDCFPRDKPCGGALRPKVVEDFNYIKSGLNKIPHSMSFRAKMYSPSLKNHVDYKPGKIVMYNIRRRHFDALLTELAKDAGAELRENTEVKKVSVRDNGCTFQLKDGKEAKGKLILGAGGMQDPVARYLRKKEGLPEKWPKSDIGLVVMEEYEVGDKFIVDRYGDEHTTYFHLKPFGLFGYAWSFSKKQTLNIGFGAFWDEMKKIDIKQIFSNYLALLKREHLVPDNLRLGKPKGAQIPLRGAIKKTYTDRILLLGDAAGFVSPLGGDGIYYGMFSGKIASDIVNYSVENDAFDKDTLSRYQDEWHKLWGKDLKVLCYFADKLFEKTEQIIKYASKDELLKQRCVELYTGECSAKQLKSKITSRIMRDFFLYDVFRLK